MPIPLYAEIKDGGDIFEFMEPNDLQAKTRIWAIIPKRLIVGAQTVSIETKSGEHIKIAKIGKQNS